MPFRNPSLESELRSLPAFAIARAKTVPGDQPTQESADVCNIVGGVISPLLANVFLHYVFELWIQWWRSKRARGEIVVIRFAHDFVIGFEHKDEAEACLGELRDRFAKFGLKLHGKKTRLIEFGRHAARRRQARGEGRPETFDFLGFTHRCDVTRAGWFALRRETIAKRLRATLAAIKEKLVHRRHWPIDAVGRWLGQVARGWMNYHATPGNSTRMKQFLDAVKRLWLHQLRRRSQRHRLRWSRFVRLAERYLPPIKVLPPFPSIPVVVFAPDSRQEPYE